MEYIIKLSLICIISGVFSLLLKKTNPEMALLLGTCTVIFSFYCFTDLYYEVSNQLKQWQDNLMFPKEYFVPLVKCLGIAIVTQFGINICKDAGQSAVAMGLQLCGNVATALCILPLLDHLFSIIEGLI